MSDNTSDPRRMRGRWSLEKLIELLPTVGGAIAVGLLVSLVITGFGTFGTTVPTMSAASSTDGQASGGGKASGGAPVSVNVELGDLFIKPSSIDVPAGRPVTVHVVNHGAQQHSLSLEGQQMPLISPGTSTTLHWPAFTKSEQAWCEVPGHKDAGMLMNINVTGAPAAAAPAGGAAAGSGVNPADAKIDPNAKPAAGWKAFDPTLQPAPGGTEHDVTFHVQQLVNEVAPGVKQLQWTYNGHAPGPILRGKIGDTFKITLVNDGTMPHSIDFHASKVSPSVQMRTIKPHESLVYEFKAQYAGIFSYHCGADPMIYHMGNGMYGSVVIDPPNLQKVDREFVFVQSDLNLGPQNQTADMKKMMTNQNDGVVFNGYYNQYVYAPINITAGSRIRVWVDDLSINEPADFHVVGTIFDTEWKEGNYTLPPNSPTHGGSQALDLEPTQGGFVEFTLNDPGTYTFVNHKMMDLSRGAAGVFQVSAAGQGGTK